MCGILCQFYVHMLLQEMCNIIDVRILLCVSLQSAEAASNPKKIPPKFRLVTRRDDRSPMNGTSTCT